MEKGMNLRRNNRPSMQQLQYVFEMEKIKEKRGAIAQIAEICNVNHAAVSRYLKTCVENGYLNRKYEFTEAGILWINGYKRLLEELDRYLLDIGIPVKDVEANKRDMVENIDYYTILSIVREHHYHEKMMEPPKSMKTDGLIKKALAFGRWDVYFVIYRADGKQNGTISMADKGFEKPGVLIHNRRGSWLELTTHEMYGQSRLTGLSMGGRLDSLSYEQEGVICQAKMIENRLRIPLEACKLYRRQGGEITGHIMITITCSVGRCHMPESTALLTFWL